MQIVLRIQGMQKSAKMLTYLLDSGYDLGEVEEIINEALDDRSGVLLTPKEGTKDIEFFPHKMKIISVADASIDPEEL